MRRGWIALGGVAAFAGLPQCSLDCPRPRYESRAPDGGASLAACARPMAFAMPGQGGDAPGWLVLRDGEGWIRGVTSLELVGSLDLPARWGAEEVYVPLHASFPRPGSLPAPLAFVLDRIWRWRALVGLTPRDTSYR